MALITNLKHIGSRQDFDRVLKEHAIVMICCGRMGPMCIPVYAAMSELETQYPQVAFYDMEFDIPDAAVIREDPLCSGFMGLPFTMYYKNGQAIKATTSIQTIDQIRAILDELV